MQLNEKPFSHSLTQTKPALLPPPPCNPLTLFKMPPAPPRPFPYRSTIRNILHSFAKTEKKIRQKLSQVHPSVDLASLVIFWIWGKKPPNLRGGESRIHPLYRAWGGKYPFYPSSYRLWYSIKRPCLML